MRNNHGNFAVTQIAALGRDGGWDPRDQDTFVRVWLMVFDSNEYFEEQLNISRARERELCERDGDEVRDDAHETGEGSQLVVPPAKRSMVLKRMSAAVPWKSLEEIDEHIDWYAR